MSLGLTVLISWLDPTADRHILAVTFCLDDNAAAFSAYGFWFSNSLPEVLIPDTRRVTAPDFLLDG